MTENRKKYMSNISDSEAIIRKLIKKHRLVITRNKKELQHLNSLDKEKYSDYIKNQTVLVKKVIKASKIIISSLKKELARIKDHSLTAFNGECVNGIQFKDIVSYILKIFKR